MLWEGPDAVEDFSKIPQANLNAASSAATKKVVLTPGPEPEPEPPAPASDSAEDPDSEDEYVADGLKTKGSKRRRARRLSFSSESGSESSGPENNGRSRKPASPGASRGQLKRKAQRAHAPPPKRKREASSDASDDPARAFCLGKLESVFRDIFLRYPHVREDASGGPLVEKKPEDLTEDEKAKVEEAAKQFATDLEQCVYDIYCEPDKQGKPSAGGKYKDRFRMLQFNLSKIDRTVLHKRIASADITPKEISLMSSTDLANEQTKQSIKIAEKEALEHSILEKTAIPRAKLTHKGLEDIEDFNNEASNLREREIERQREEEEKRERERAARLRSQRQRTTSVSVPPESPTTPGGASWGGPPRVPIHAMTPTDEMGGSFAGPSSEMSIEPEMNLADLINIDDEPLAQDAPSAPAVPSSPISGLGDSLSTPVAAAPSPTLTTGISPFASKPEASRTSSFDLNSLWAAPKKDDSPSPTVASPPQQSHSPVPIEEPQDGKEEPMDLDEPDDMDFDMFLEEKEGGNSSIPTAEALQAAFDDLPQVWSGKINMPLDSTIPQETPVVARQVGGRTLESGSALWKTLFPSELLRIDGRVPVDKSAQFLLQTRMNSTRELIAVAFSPGSSSANAGFQILTDFLIAKGRHGLVFPWGNRPKDYHPGKELYIIPLLSSDTVPDYMELLDNLHLPKIRNSNYLIGIWVLNKGKLAPPPPPPAPVPAPTPAPTVIPQFNMPTLPAPAPGMPVPQLTFEPSVLAAEVAALTPEQVRMMLQSLTATTLNAIPVAAPLPPPQTAPPPPQAWGGHRPPMPGPAMGYPPPHPMGHQQQHGPPQQQYGQQPPYDRRDYNRDPYPPPPGPGYDYDRGGRDHGWNRGGRGRGRGRGGGGGPGPGPGGPPPPADSGWPRRRDSGPQSPSQRRWN
ncbi:hypothetical protein B0H19DRAFT_508904 [Mycena capillaripes]|nr:hypothetical protein B0H19DRAFT_508904 [Mycena capillaripes]